ncbi:MAG: hypothetical protein BWY76_01488 [bacterium ADurb.Bin429]|nr:MAG: hypothetical protein BWY76_01488 [bacterium ADurb.Bin429]
MFRLRHDGAGGCRRRFSLAFSFQRGVNAGALLIEDSVFEQFQRADYRGFRSFSRALQHGAQTVGGRRKALRAQTGGDQRADLATNFIAYLHVTGIGEEQRLIMEGAAHAAEDQFLSAGAYLRQDALAILSFGIIIVVRDDLVQQDALFVGVNFF